ncbi:MAG: hypothetical protein ACYTG0_38210 [Planctomycetota bacterium]
MNRTVGQIILVVVIIAVVVGYKMFVVDSGEVGSFNDKLVETITESDERRPAFDAVLEQYKKGTEVDVERMRAMQAELAKGLQDDIGRIRKITVPDDELCKAFHSACLEYVQNSSQIAEKYKEVIDYIAKNNPGNEDNAAAVDEMLGQLLLNDVGLHLKVGVCQKQMADSYDLTLE